MRKGSIHFKKILSFVLFCLVLFTLPVMAQDEEIVPGGPITKIDLGVESLNLGVGESYTFNVSFEPEKTVLRTLDWYVSDESVISIDPLTDTVTALANGEARVFAESFDQFSYAVCTVTVGESVSKDASVMKSGSDFFGLSEKDMKKISAETLVRYIDFIADSAMDEASYETVSDRVFDVLAAVKRGTAEAQSQRAKDCGVEDSEALKELNVVTLTGSLDSILKYAKENPDLLEIYELGPFEIEDPIEEEVSSESVQKAVGLRDHVNDLTYINFAQDKLGLNGKGRWIAVIDSGINYKNAQFSGNRQIIEKCFSKTKNFKSFSVYSVCTDGAEGQGKSAPAGALKKDAFNHGSHVTGIAAGKDGIAPLANIISIQSHTEKRWTCKDAAERKSYSCGGNRCCKTYINNSDLARAYDYLVTLSKTKNIKIDAVNMSYGEHKEYTSTSTCDKEHKWEKDHFDKMIAQGMLPVVAAGNESFNRGITSAGCLSNAYAVGGLANNKTPLLRKDSNHSRKVDITAPGTDIYSAGYTQPMMYKGGTSMATPMVTGAIALVKQLYPGMTSAEAGQFLKTVSQKTVNKRVGTNWSFKYKKPVLTFGYIHKLTVPYYNWISGGANSVTIKTYRMNRNATFKAEVRTLSGAVIPNVSVVPTIEGNFTKVRVSSPNMQNGHIYKIKLTRTITAGGRSYSSSVNEYGRPVNTTSVMPKARGMDSGVVLESVNDGIRYYIYDQATGKLVKQVSVKDGSKPIAVKGLVNGRVYSVSATIFRQITINRNGKKQNINFYSSESARNTFMPMSKPFNAMVSYPAVANPTSATVNCTADKGADGIKVFYRKSSDPSGNWTLGCKTAKGKFTCDVQNTGRGYDFQVRKYKTIGAATYDGPMVLVKGR